jgi:hypothetical protein
MEKYVKNIKYFDFNVKFTVIRLCKHLKHYNPLFVENLKFYIQINWKALIFSDILLILAYLIDARSFPY